MIQTETHFIWDLLKSILLWPYVLILVLFGKRKSSELALPLIIIYSFAKQAKLTFWLIVTNILLFILAIFLPESFVQLFLSYPSDLFNLKLHTLITSGFMHANITHLLGNMLALFLFGRIVEKQLGRKKMALVYFLALIISNIFSSLVNHLLLHTNTPGLGASGAIMGLVATAILLDPLYITFQLIIPAPIMVLGWLYIFADITGILGNATDGIGHFAHLGGFLSITIIVAALEYNHKKKIQRGFIINIISLLLGAVIYYFFFR